MNKTSLRYKIFTVGNFIFMLFVILITVLPYLHVLAKALNDGTDTMIGGLSFYPRKPTLEHFMILFRDSSMYRSFFLSVSRVIFGTIFGVAVQFSAAYALSKKDLPGKNQMLIFLIIPMFFSGGIIPTYLLFVKLNLINNFLVYIIPTLCSFYNILVIKSYIMSSIPESLSEAAVLDGANEVTTLWRIIFPLSKPVLATVALWIAVSHWNDWTTTLMFITQERLHTLQYKLMQLIKESERIQKLIQEAALTGNATEAISSVKTTPESLVSAQVVITTIPIIIVYPFLQKYFVQGVIIGAVK